MVNVRASKPHPGASFGLNDSYVGTGKRRRELNCRGWTDSAHARYLTGGDLNLDTTSFIYQDGLHWRGRRTALRANVSPFPYLMQGVFCCLRSFFFFFFFSTCTVRLAPNIRQCCFSSVLFSGRLCLVQALHKVHLRTMPDKPTPSGTSITTHNFSL
jgi:hypothetical protein